jgi:hypothetical protein
MSLEILLMSFSEVLPPGCIGYNVYVQERIPAWLAALTSNLIFWTSGCPRTVE